MSSIHDSACPPAPAQCHLLRDPSTLPILKTISYLSVQTFFEGRLNKGDCLWPGYEEVEISFPPDFPFALDKKALNYHALYALYFVIGIMNSCKFHTSLFDFLWTLQNGRKAHIGAMSIKGRDAFSPRIGELDGSMNCTLNPNSTVYVYSTSFTARRRQVKLAFEHGLPHGIASSITSEMMTLALNPARPNPLPNLDLKVIASRYQTALQFDFWEETKDGSSLPGIRRCDSYATNVSSVYL